MCTPASRAPLGYFPNGCAVRFQDADGPVRIDQIFLGRLSNLFRGDGPEAGNDFEDEVPVAQRGVLPELQGAIEERVLGIGEPRFNQILGPLQLFFRHRCGLEPGDLLRQCLFRGLPGFPRSDPHGQGKEGRVE